MNGTDDTTISDLERKDPDPTYERELEELRQHLEDLKVVYEMLGAVYDEEGTRRSFTEWLERIPPAEREERLRVIDQQLRQATDYEIVTVIENGEVVEVDMLIAMESSCGFWANTILIFTIRKIDNTSVIESPASQ